jgi:hypothetical protein
MISDDGNLVIIAHGTTMVWSTQANITANSTVAVLLADGRREPRPAELLQLLGRVLAEL